MCPTRVRHTEGEGNYLVASRDIDAGEVKLLGLAVGDVGVGLCLFLGELSHTRWSCYIGVGLCVGIGDISLTLKILTKQSLLVGCT